jgi:hypothetical protein
LDSKAFGRGRFPPAEAGTPYPEVSLPTWTPVFCHVAEGGSEDRFLDPWNPCLPKKAREDSRTPRRSRGIEDQFPRCSRCNARSPHRGHFSTVAVRGSPAVPHRTPPASQTDRSNPQEHRSIHDLDSSSMASAMRRGRIRSRNLCRRLTLEAVYASRRSELVNRFQSSKQSPSQSFWHSHAPKPTTTPTGCPILRITLHPFNSSSHSTCASTPTAPAPGG